MPKTAVRDPPGTIGWKLTHCPPSSKWGPRGNTGEIKAARKGIVTVPYNADGPGQVSSLTGTSLTYGSYKGLTFTGKHTHMHINEILHGLNVKIIQEKRLKNYKGTRYSEPILSSLLLLCLSLL